MCGITAIHLNLNPLSKILDPPLWSDPVSKIPLSSTVISTTSCLCTCGNIVYLITDFLSPHSYIHLPLHTDSSLAISISQHILGSAASSLGLHLLWRYVHWNPPLPPLCNPFQHIAFHLVKLCFCFLTPCSLQICVNHPSASNFNSTQSTPSGLRTVAI